MVIHWMVALLMRVLLKDVIHKVVVKKQAEQRATTRRLVVLHTMIFSMSAIVLLIRGETLEFTLALCVSLGLGLIDGPAQLAYWRGVKLNMPAFVLLGRWPDVICLALAYIFLGELTVLADPVIFTGVICCIAAGLLFAKFSQREKFGEHNQLGWLLFYSLVVGIVAGGTWFAMRALNVQGDISVTQFLTAKFFGSTLSCMAVKFVRGKYDAGPPLTFREKSSMIPLALIDFFSHFFLWNAFSSAPATVVQPIVMVSRTMTPTVVIAAWFQSEREKLKRMGWKKVGICLSIAIVGCTMIVIGF